METNDSSSFQYIGGLREDSVKNIYFFPFSASILETSVLETSYSSVSSVVNAFSIFCCITAFFLSINDAATQSNSSELIPIFL